MLEAAGAGLVPERAVQWVVEGQELQLPLTRLEHVGAFGVDLHPLGRGDGAGGGGFGLAFDLDHAHPAGPDGVELPMAAEVRPPRAFVQPDLHHPTAPAPPPPPPPPPDPPPPRP